MDVLRKLIESKTERKDNMKKSNIIWAAVLVAGIAAGFVAGRMGAARPEKDEAPQAAATATDEALARAKKRIAALEAELAGAKRDEQRVRKLAARAEDAVGKVLKDGEKLKDEISLSVGTNVDVYAEMKKQLPDDAFVAATNALERMKAANAERAKGRREYLASLDVSGLSAKERENHKRFMELLGRREKVMSKMKGIIPDPKTISELVQIEMEMRPLAKQERKSLLGAVTRELGYSGDDGAVVTDTLEGIFDSTSGGGLAGLGDLMDGAAEGAMDGAEVGTPEIKVETHVIGL